MEYKNVLITGGCGFIGSNAVNYFVKKYPNTNFINIDKLELFPVNRNSKRFLYFKDVNLFNTFHYIFLDTYCPSSL